MDAVFPLLELALFVVTVAWVGNRPTVAKVSAVIGATWLVEFGGLVYEASMAGMGPIEYYLQQLNSSLEQMGAAMSYVQRSVFESAASTVAGCLPAIYVVLSSAYVFVALCARWVFDRVRHRSQWGAFSQVDLSVWWVVPLIAGIVLYVVSLVPGIPSRDGVFLAALNVIMVSLIPLFVQGAAVGKGIVNRSGLRLSWQLVVGFFALVTGVAFVVLPLVGLIDFWANFRKLPRDGGDPDGGNPAQRRLPE